MSIYFKDRMKELAEEQLEKDLKSFDGVLINLDFKLTDEEFTRFYYVFQISPYTDTKEFFKHWKFYCGEDVVEHIILEDDILKQYFSEPCDFDIEECLEQGKEEKIVFGFFYIGEDLWLINEGE